MKNQMILSALVGGALFFSPTASFALGGSDEPSSNTTPVCKTGYVYNKGKKRCVRGKAKRTKTCPIRYIYSRSQRRCIRKWSQIIPDTDLKAQGWALAYAGNYKGAIDVFSHVAAKNDPEALNGLGYSHRKLGKVTEGIQFYKLALTINPNYLLAREYLGEGYVAAGRITLAKHQLSEIKKRCGTTCREYTILAGVIKSGSSSNW